MDIRLSAPTARTTGLLYLAMAIAAVPGFLVLRPMLHDPGSASATLANLVADEGLARLGIALELALVVAQTLTALWFFRLFRPVDSFAAAALATFAAINAVAVLGSAAGLATALDAALAGDADGAQLMYGLSGNMWGAGAVFFGLWLLPMGLLALRSGMPRALGWLLLAGGAGYVVSALLAYLAPGAAPVGDALTYLATVGEFWMIGTLLWIGLRRRPSAAAGTGPAEKVGSAASVHP